MSDLKQKPFDIPKRLVWEAYRKVAANKGAAGVDGQSIAEFEEDLKGNLYKLWNRLSSGTYFPPPVRGVEIPKKAGGTRMLGVPTVADRIAQTVVCMVLEPTAEPVFHPDSYGYRPGRSALHAVAKARRRCWENDWVIDMDIRAFFDTVPWDLVLRAVKHHCRGAVGPAVCEALAGSAAATAGRHYIREDDGNPAGQYCLVKRRREYGYSGARDTASWCRRCVSPGRRGHARA